MSCFKQKTIRLKVELDRTSSILDILTSQTPEAYVGTDLRFEIAFFYNGALADVTCWDEVSLALKSLTDKTGNALASQTVSSGSINTSLVLADWEAGTDQHVAIEFANGAVNFNLGGEDSAFYHLVVHGLTSDVPAKVIVMGISVFKMIEDGSGSTAETPTVGANLIPTGAVYDNAGVYTLIGLTADKVYEYDNSTNDTNLVNGVQTLTADGRFVAGATTVVLNGTPDAVITARVWHPSYYTADEADARFALAFDTNSLWTAINAAQADATQALLDAAAAHGEVFTAADQTAMLALNAEKGDFAHRTDSNRLWILNGDDPTDINEWFETPLSFEWLGAWSGATTYSKNQAVTRGVNSYISQENANLNNDPSDPANVGTGQPWGNLAQGSSLQISTETPQAIAIGSAGATGGTGKVADAGHQHPAPDLADWSTNGFLAAVDKRRIDNTETGLANGKINASAISGVWTYLVGEFTTWDGNTATRIVKIDKDGKADPTFLANLGAGFDAAPEFIVVLPGGEIVVGASTKTSFKGGASTWIHKIDADGNLSAGWNAVDTIATTGTDQLLAIGQLDPDKIALLSPRTLRIVDENGQSLFTEIADADMHSIDCFSCYVFLSSRPTADYGGVSNPQAVKMLDFCEDSGGLFTGDIDATFASNAGAGWGASGHSIKVSPDGSFVVVTGIDSGEEASDFDWNAVANSGSGMAKVAASGASRGAYASPWATTIVMNDAAETAEIFAIDSNGRIYFGGNVATVNGTSVTANRLYRINADGTTLVEFGTFDGTVEGVALMEDDRLLVYGDFNTYGGVRVGKSVILTDLGVRIHHLRADDPITRTGVVREIYVPASSMTPPQTAGATAAVNTTGTNGRAKDVFRFIHTSDNEVQFDLMISSAWNKSSVKLVLDLESEGVIVTANGIVFELAMACLEDADSTDKAWGSGVQQTTSAEEAGKRFESPVYSLTPPSTPGTRSCLSFRVKRTPGHAADTANDYVRLRGAFLQYTESATEPSPW